MSETTFPWPPEIRVPSPDEDPGFLAARAIEAALDLMTGAELAGGAAGADQWKAAADSLYAARWFCLEAAAREHRSRIAAARADGKEICSHCYSYQDPKAMERCPCGTPKAGMPESHYFVCAACQADRNGS